MAVAWSAASIANVFADKDTIKQPSDIDPYGLLSDGEEEKNKPGVIPYNPMILQAIQNSGKF